MAGPLLADESARSPPLSLLAALPLPGSPSPTSPLFVPPAPTSPVAFAPSSTTAPGSRPDLGSVLNSGSGFLLDFDPSFLPDAGFAPAVLPPAELPECPPRRRRSSSNVDSPDAMDSIAFASANLPQIPAEGRSLRMSSSGDASHVVPLTLESVLPALGDLGELKSDPQSYCDICHLVIESPKALFVSGLAFHPTCLSCVKCRAPLRPPSCIAYKKKYYCESCITVRQRICRICDRAIDPCEKEVALPDGAVVHAGCLACFMCAAALGGGDCENVEGEVFCVRCAAIVRERRCEQCGQIVIREGVVIAGKWFHDEHIACVECRAPIAPGAVVVHHGRIYCQKHGFVFAHSCEYCKAFITGSEVPQLLWNRKLYHLECLVCRVCGTALSPETAKRFHNRPHCQRCWELRAEERESGERERKHLPEAARGRIERFRERGVEICAEPKYQTGEPPFETATEITDGQAFQPRFKKK